MMKLIPCAATLAALTMCLSVAASAATSAGEKVEDAAHTAGQKIDHAASDVSKATKKTARSVKEKTCHLFHGKLECLGKKVKHRAENAADDVKSE